MDELENEARGPLPSRGPSAQNFLDLADQIHEAMREAENLSFHHCPPESPEGLHYARLIAMGERIDKQIERFPKIIPDQRSALWGHGVV